ncbi:MAG: copper resistance protein [Acidobacteria bacterium]|jgi:suppressor for copper-sensitivity B|nr:copper resistance protein [Acidobacteriota bacterium]
MPSRPRLALVLAATLASSAAGEATVGGWVDQGEARVRLVSSLAEAAPGAEAGLGVEFVLAPGWHVYWKNAGDAGYAPRLRVESGLAPGATLLFPAPERFELPGYLVAFGYEHEVVYPVAARLDPGVTSGAAVIAARLDYLVCAETCIPHEAGLELSLPLGVERRDAGTAPALERWRARLPVASGAPGAPTAHARLVRGEGSALALELALVDPGRAAAPDLFFEVDETFALGRPVFRAGAEGPRFRVPLAPLDATKPLPERLRFAWTATGFERAGERAAYEGVVELAPPPAPRTGRMLGLVALAALLVTLTAAGLARRARRTPIANP